VNVTVDEARSSAIDLLRASGAEKIAHPGGDLFNHLVRTEQILRAWREDDAVCLAGLCHAFYGTAGFPTSLLALDNRDTLRVLIGVEAEALVYEYCSCDRRATYPALRCDPVAFVDRFTGTTTEVRSEDLRAFAVISIANELDIARVVAFEAKSAVGIRELCAKLAPHAPAAARIALQELDDHQV
jgi:hypothetical protein